ncbi:hypothetical protein WJX75_003161 [Coccomyxa subellipsoidea]|uniref:Uncharacterized protein n=1 Tax=Coccomyxa subellipsoidea TaxID=248742 RepID=A0ABR2YKM6_9CHLO
MGQTAGGSFCEAWHMVSLRAFVGLLVLLPAALCTFPLHKEHAARRQSLETVKLSFPLEVSNDLSWDSTFTSTLSSDPSFGKDIVKGSVPTAHASFPLSFGFNIGKGRKLKALAYPSKAKSGGSASRDLLQTKFGLPTEVTNIFSWDAAFKSTLSVDPSIELGSGSIPTVWGSKVFEAKNPGFSFFDNHGSESESPQA